MIVRRKKLLNSTILDVKAKALHVKQRGMETSCKNAVVFKIQAMGSALLDIRHRFSRENVIIRFYATINTEDDMILELADIRIQAGKQDEFDAAIVRGVREVISKAKGFRGYKINKGIESPERYVLMIFWETLENHTVDFRQSPAFTEWRSIVGPFFAQPPVVEHFSLLDKSVD